MTRGEARSARSGVGFTAALSRVWYWSLAVGAYSVVPVWLAPPAWVEQVDLGPLVRAALGFGVGFVLVFRINRAYERWWEARTLWGRLVNVSRNLALKARALVLPDAAERAELARLVTGFADALRIHLHHRGMLQEVPGFTDASERPVDLPSHLAGRLLDRFVAWKEQGRLSDADLWLIDREWRELMEVAGGCERIQNTLMSQSFPTLVRQGIALYMLYMPWSLADEFGPLAIPLAIVMSYFVIAAEGIAHYVERPFGHDDDHVDLDSICESIRTSVNGILSEE